MRSAVQERHLVDLRGQKVSRTANLSATRSSSASNGPQSPAPVYEDQPSGRTRIHMRKISGYRAPPNLQLNHPSAVIRCRAGTCSLVLDIITLWGCRIQSIVDTGEDYQLTLVAVLVGLQLFLLSLNNSTRPDRIWLFNSVHSSMSL